MRGPLTLATSVHSCSCSSCARPCRRESSGGSERGRLLHVAPASRIREYNNTKGGTNALYNVDDSRELRGHFSFVRQRDSPHRVSGPQVWLARISFTRPRGGECA